MEEDEIQAQPCKLPRVGNGTRNDFINNRIVSEANNKMNNEQCPADEEAGELRRRNNGGSTDGSTNRFHSWHHNSSRIVRVSRASGGKDRHSKVMTSRGLRDRRVRLSVSTAIQFYDLQDRLGCDQPSKAVEWLIKAASDAISELPSLNNAFPDYNSKQPSDEHREEQGFDDSVEKDIDGDERTYQQNQSHNLSLSKSACSSTSETSKGSGLSLSRSEIRVKARERARERAAKEKDKENESGNISHHHIVNSVSQTASFTELLTGGFNSVPTSSSSPIDSVHQNHAVDEPNLFNKGVRQQWLKTPMDYFGSALFGRTTSSRTTHHQSSGFSAQMQMANSMNPQTVSISPFNVTTENHSDQLQPFSFIPDHLMPVATSQTGDGDYNLNFTISSGLAGFNRGTLQSNSPSLLPHHLQRFSPIDGLSNVPFLIGAAPTMDNHRNHHHQFPPSGLDGRLQLYYGNGSQRSDQKDKGKS